MYSYADYFVPSTNWALRQNNTQITTGGIQLLFRSEIQAVPSLFFLITTRLNCNFSINILRKDDSIIYKFSFPIINHVALHIIF